MAEKKAMIITNSAQLELGLGLSLAITVLRESSIWHAISNIFKEVKQPPNENRLVQLQLILTSTKCGYGSKQLNLV